jgi:hypothetical protein
LTKLDPELAYKAMRTSGEDFFAVGTFPVGDSCINLVTAFA